jgi:hypothetical protein
MPRHLFSPALILLVFWLGGAPVSGWSHRKESPPPAVGQPKERILVAPLGYRAPGSLYLLSGRAFSSLDFLDAHHLLFTFHQPRLMRREPHPDRFDDDQVIQAVVLNLPGGTVQTSAEWRMHDRWRYLWPLGGGKFLVRQKNSYSLTDATLKLRPYIDVPTSVLSTEVSSDGRVLVIEHQYERHSADQHRKLEAQAQEYGEPPPAEDTQITVVNIASREVLAALRTESPINVPISSTGYVGVSRDKDEAQGVAGVIKDNDASQGVTKDNGAGQMSRDKGAGQFDDQFLIRFVPFGGESVILGRVASACTPHENFLNQKALVIESCGPKSGDVFLDAWTTDGKKLWTGRRDGHFVWPTFAYSRKGDRFAVSMLHVSHLIDVLDSLNDQDVREQVIQVFDSATGALLMATNASPVLTAGQNFALSDDGERLAVLREGAIEIYDVPSPPAAGAGDALPPQKKK